MEKQPRVRETIRSLQNDVPLRGAAHILYLVARALEIDQKREADDNNQRMRYITGVPHPSGAASWSIPANEQRCVARELGTIYEKLQNPGQDYIPIAQNILGRMEEKYRDRFGLPTSEAFASAVVERMAQAVQPIIADTRGNTFGRAVDAAEIMGRERVFGPEILFFDINGLKSVNDVLGHAAGDQYLALTGAVFQDAEIVVRCASDDGSIPAQRRKTGLQWLREQGIFVDYAHQSGDEFLLSVMFPPAENREAWFEKNATYNGITREPGETIGSFACRLVQNDMASIDATSVVDFSKEDVRNSYAAKGVDVPKSFRFRLSASVGTFSAADMYDGFVKRWEKMRDAGEDESMSVRADFHRQRNRINESDVLEEILRLYVGRFVHSADMRMAAQKKRDRETRAQSENPDDGILQNIYNLGRENLQEKNKRLQEENERLQEENERLQEVISRIEISNS